MAVERWVEVPGIPEEELLEVDGGIVFEAEDGFTEVGDVGDAVESLEPMRRCRGQ